MRSTPHDALALSGGGALFAALYGARVYYSGHGLYGFLLWNLLLAAVPWLCAVGLGRAAARREARAAGPLVDGLAWALGAVWFAFLPNAPYLITDFVHLRARPPVPLWYDVILLGAAALTGLLAGAFSLRRVQRVVARTLGPRPAGLLVLVALPASGFGIYLGRFERLNSWDLVLHPRSVLADVLAAPSLRTLVVTVATAALLAVAYLAVRERRSEGSPPRRAPGAWSR